MAQPLDQLPPATAVGEYQRIAAFRPTERHRGLLQMARTLEATASHEPADEQSTHCTYRDDSEIPRADMDHVRDVVWRHMVIEPWQPGDVVAIDNHSTSHGLMPYQGARRIVVYWA